MSSRPTSILILSSHPRLGLPSGLFPSGFSTKLLYTPLQSLIRATCPSHLSSLNLISRTIFGEGCLSSSYLFVLFSSPLLPRPSYAQIFSSAPYSQTPSSYVPPSTWATKFHTRTKNRQIVWHSTNGTCLSYFKSNICAQIGLSRFMIGYSRLTFLECVIFGKPSFSSRFHIFEPCSMLHRSVSSASQPF